MEQWLPADVGAVFESLAVGYVTLDPSWVITNVNPAAEPALGRTADELVGQDLWEMFPGARELDFGRVYERVMATRVPEAFEAFYPGLQVWFELRVQPADPGIAVYFLDVTAQHVAEERAAAATERLELLAHVSEALNASPDPDVALAELAQVVVPHLADWSVVTVIAEDGVFRDVGWAHRDPARADEVAAYGAIQSASMTDTSPVATALRTGEPVLVPHLSDGDLKAVLHDPTAIAVARRLQPHGVAIMPMTGRGRTLGMIALVTTHDRGPHTDDEIATALEVARRAGPVLDSAQAAARARRLAESMQMNLLDISGAAAGLDVVARYRPASDGRQVGGDWYDSFTLPSGTTVLAIGDVMGHDLAAIAAMAQLRTMMRTTAWTLRHGPAEALAATDDASLALGPRVFATALTADLAPRAVDGSVAMRWSNAGHPPPILITAEGAVVQLEAELTDPPLGVVRQVTRHNHSVVLPPGSTVLLYTDGLIERRTRDMDDSVDALTAALADLADRPLADLLDPLIDTMLGGKRGADDVAVIAVRIDDVTVAGTATRFTHDTAPDRAALSITTAASDDQLLQQRSRRFPAETSAVAGTRRWCEYQLAQVLPASEADMIDDAILVVSELVTNAVRAQSSYVVLTLETTRTTLTITSGDNAAGEPEMTHADPTQPHGRGLAIVATLSNQWGVRRTADGKQVWAELLLGQ